MSKQLQKNFTDGQVKSLLKSYLDKKIKINYILQILRIKRSRFFELLAKYRKDPNNFSSPLAFAEGFFILKKRIFVTYDVYIIYILLILT